MDVFNNTYKAHFRPIDNYSLINWYRYSIGKKVSAKYIISGNYSKTEFTITTHIIWKLL